MKKQLVVLPILLGSLLTAFSAQAAKTSELKVKGFILPSACQPVFTGVDGNVVNYGDIGASELSPTAFSKLPEKTITLTMTCDAPSKAAIQFVDNQQASRITGITKTISSGYTDTYNFGLGEFQGKKVGGFVIRAAAKPMLDSKSGYAVTSTDLTKWTRHTSDVAIPHNGQYLSFGTGSAPLPFKNLTATLKVQAVINKTADLPMTEKIPMDGLATMEIRYL